MAVGMLILFGVFNLIVFLFGVIPLSPSSLSEVAAARATIPLFWEAAPLSSVRLLSAVESGTGSRMTMTICRGRLRRCRGASMNSCLCRLTRAAAQTMRPHSLRRQSFRQSLGIGTVVVPGPARSALSIISTSSSPGYHAHAGARGVDDALVTIVSVVSPSCRSPFRVMVRPLLIVRCPPYVYPITSTSTFGLQVCSPPAVTTTLLTTTITTTTTTMLSTLLHGITRLTLLPLGTRLTAMTFTAT